MHGQCAPGSLSPHKRESGFETRSCRQYLYENTVYSGSILTSQDGHVCPGGCRVETSRCGVHASHNVIYTLIQHVIE